ncbi:MAG: hypothetical protein UX09_C0046G0014 [Candidatus Uhrbacteria bacterium GW2011_GWE2_45_35]|uniref:PDZ domain-containing protein n=2 Tax=Candidatus Uhriibacteriota TaxID=1752732 RepID=A0A0G1MF08_9BACT|nr:MAG: hypothetical protein UX09_C0046G0014 [Candidatus Uhrbacteria bacterium GW2011_GWE2_45_35]
MFGELKRIMKMFSTTSILFLAVALGAGAGIIATALTMGSLQDYFSVISNSGPIGLSGERPRAEPGSFEQAVEEVKEKVAPATVEIFVAPSDLTGAYEPGEGGASGFFITSDGWLATIPYGFNITESGSTKVLFGEKIYSIQKVVRDSSSAVVFLKIDVTNAPVTAFGNALSVVSGDRLFVVGAANGFLATSLFRTVRTGAISGPAAWVSRRFELNQKINSLFSGAAVSNSSGEVIGILDANNFSETVTVLPFTAIKSAIDSLLKEGTVTPLWFGAVATDLSRAIGYDADYTRGYSQGALLGTITKGGPAEVAGLLRGDIVTSVGGLEITDQQSLDELLSAYRVGDTVNLVIDRAGTFSKIDLILGTH